jgi:membrane-associated phospholipid phosphatase
MECSLPGRWHGALVFCLLLGLMTVTAGEAQHFQPTVSTHRFHLWQDLQDIATYTWGGVETAVAPTTLVYLLPAAAVVGGASFADDTIQDPFVGHTQDATLARAGKAYGYLYFGPAQAGVYLVGTLTDDPKLAETGKKTLAALVGAQALIQPLKYATHRRRPDGSNHLSFPSGHAGAVSSMIPSVYADYGLVPAMGVAASAAFIGATALYGNAHHLSDVLAGYAIGVGWGLLVETYTRRHPSWALLPMSDGRTTQGLAFHLQF